MASMSVQVLFCMVPWSLRKCYKLRCVCWLLFHRGSPVRAVFFVGFLIRHRLGLTFTQLFSCLFAKNEMHILIVGFNAAGKTTPFCTSSSSARLSLLSLPLVEVLGTLVKAFKASFLPLFDELSSYMMLMLGKDKIAEERRIAICIFDDVAEQCREAALSDWLVIGSPESIEYFC